MVSALIRVTGRIDPDLRVTKPDKIEGMATKPQRQLDEAASALVEEALSKYLASQRLIGFAEKMEHRAKAKGIQQEDVARLVEEVRNENKVSGR